MKVLIVQHESFEAPGAICEWVTSRGHACSIVSLYAGERCPRDVSDAGLLVVMGGPQSPSTSTEECNHFDAKAEISLIRRYIDAGRSVVGVCLGAQLIGEALGAHYEHSPHREIGVFPISLTASGLEDPYFKDLPPVFSVGHWHGDMPGLTEDSEVLAVSEGCPRQIVRYRPNVYGFQCHFEFTPEAVEGMIVSCADEFDRFGGFPYIETPSQLRSHDFTEMNRYLFGFLDYLSRIPGG